MSTVAAVVLNYNRERDVLACVASLKASSRAPDRIIVVDNASSDGSVQSLRYAHQDLVILETGANCGYAGGMNRGIDRALGLGVDYLFLLNSDTLVDPEYLREILSALERYPDAGAAMGTIYRHPETSRVWCAGGRLIPWRGTGVCMYDVPAIHEGGEGIKQISFVTGCGFVARSSALRTAGNFDERFFMYVEDTELSRRFTVNGFALLYVPKAIMYHKVGDETPNPAQLYFTARNRLLFAHVSLRGFAKAVAFTYLYTVYAGKLAFWSVTKRFWFEALRYGIADFNRGTLGEGRGFSLSGGMVRSGSSFPRDMKRARSV